MSKRKRKHNRRKREAAPATSPSTAPPRKKTPAPSAARRDKQSATGPAKPGPAPTHAAPVSAPEPPAPRPEPVSAATSQHTHKASAKTQFAKWAVTYDRSLLNEVIFFPSIRICQEHILRWQQSRPDPTYRALDIGCGTGTLLATLASDQAAEQLVGLDFSPEMVSRTARKFAEGPFADKLAAVNADAERLPFADNAFDIITCCNSFHHYPHQPRAVAEVHRVLRPHGRVILIDGFRDNVVGWVIFDVVVETIEKHVHHCAWSEVRRMFADAGFHNVAQEKRGVLAPVLVSLGTKAA